MTEEPFLGRQVAIHEIISRCLDKSFNRRVFIKGMGGMGKSALARAVGRWFRDRGAWKDGVWWVNLRGVSNVVDARARIAIALGLELNYVVNSQALAKVLEDKQLLLILDDIDNLLVASQEGGSTREDLSNLAHCLFGCKGLVALFTSRQNPPIWGGPAYELGHLDAQSAWRLFRQLSGPPKEWMIGEDPGFSFQSVLKFLDGYPLAIRLAAHNLRCTRCGIDELDNRLRGNPRPILDSKTEPTDRDNSLYAALDISFKAMPQGAQQLYPILYLFPAGLSDLAAYSLLGKNSIAILERMLDFSAVEISRDDGRRFGLPEPARDYAKGKLLASEEYRVSRMALKWYCERLASLDLELIRDEIRGTFSAASWVTRELPNIRALATWGIEQEDSSSDRLLWSARCIGLLSPYLKTSSSAELKSHWRDISRAKARATEAQDDLAIAHIHRAESDAAATKLDVALAIKLLEEASKAYKSQKQFVHLASVSRGIASIQDYAHNYDGAIASYEASAQYLCETSHLLEAAYLYGKCGDLKMSRIRDHSAAHKYWDRAFGLFLKCARELQLEVSKRTDDSSESRQAHSRCIAAYCEAFDLAEKSGNFLLQASVLEDQGHANRSVEDWDAALSCYTKSLEYYSKAEDDNKSAELKSLITQVKSILER